MNLRLVAKLLGVVSLLIGAAMCFSLPWAYPQLGVRNGCDPVTQFESRGFFALVASVIVSLVLGGLLLWFGRQAKGQLFRKEAMAVVGLSWVIATMLGALPFLFSGTYRGPAVRVWQSGQPPQVLALHRYTWNTWLPKPGLPDVTMQTLAALSDAGSSGLTEQQLANVVGSDGVASLRQLQDDPDWQATLCMPGDDSGLGPADNYRIRWVPMDLADALFESQSGFSTTGATVICDLESPELVPHCILFWRSSTHFLGGLGIIVLFVAILGQGSAGKAMMRAEMPGPSKSVAQSRMQQSAWAFASIYCILNLLLAVILKLRGLTWFDSLCHAFGTLATGGFSTYNASLGHFNDPFIEYVVIVFMVLAGSNFALLYLLALGRPQALFRDVEFRTYLAIIGIATLLIVAFGLGTHDFAKSSDQSLGAQTVSGVRYGLFQVVSVMTTTGFGTADFDQWNNFGRCALLLLMFVGGCAGSTGGGLKVMRVILFCKVLWIEIERAFRPSVVRPLRVAGKPVDDREIGKNVLVYILLILVILVASWLFVVMVEPDNSWGPRPENKLIDSVSAVIATLNNIGPGLGAVGATQNYSHLSWPTKFLFVWLMMIGRVEVYAIIVLFLPAFWRDR